MKKSSCGKFVLGAAVGAGLGLLLAPKSGKETRKELKKKMDELVKKTKEIDVNEVKDDILAKIEEIEAETKELVDMAVASAKPKLEQMAEDVKKSAVKSMKAVIKKLEASEKDNIKKNSKA